VDGNERDSCSASRLGVFRGCGGGKTWPEYEICAIRHRVDQRQCRVVHDMFHPKSFFRTTHEAYIRDCCFTVDQNLVGVPRLCGTHQVAWLVSRQPGGDRMVVVWKNLTIDGTEARYRLLSCLASGHSRSNSLLATRPGMDVGHPQQHACCYRR
jgi:hypothetical protein